MGKIEKGIRVAKEKQRSGAPGVALRPVDPGPAKPRMVQLNPSTLTRNRIVALQKAHAAKAAYKMLRTRLLRRMEANGWRSLGVTSLSQGEGKTLTAVNLAISIASQPEHHVILVDLDLRNPSVYRCLGIDANPGLPDWLSGRAKVPEILVCPGVPRLHVLLNDVPVEASSETLQSQTMLDLLSSLQEHYPSSLLIFDLPPLLDVDDVLAFSPNIDAMLLVVSQGQTPRDRLPRAKELLEDMTLIGTVLNKSDEATAAYY